MSTLEKKQILNEMKHLIERNEETAKDVLLENPQLTQALLLIFMDFHWLSEEDVGHLAKPIVDGKEDKIHVHAVDDRTDIDVDVDVEMKTMETVDKNDSIQMKEYQEEEDMDEVKSPKSASNDLADPLKQIPVEHQSVL